jgi:hypothetical protein
MVKAMFGIKPSALFNMSKFFWLVPLAQRDQREGFFAYSFAYYYLVFVSSVSCLCFRYPMLMRLWNRISGLKSRRLWKTLRERTLS